MSAYDEESVELDLSDDGVGDEADEDVLDLANQLAGEDDDEDDDELEGEDDDEDDDELEGEDDDEDDDELEGEDDDEDDDELEGEDDDEDDDELEGEDDDEDDDELEGEDDDEDDDELELVKTEMVGDDDLDEMGWFGSRALKSIAKATRKVVKSKLSLVVAGGVAFAFPPAAPALPALYAARKVLQAAESRSKKKRRAVKRVLKRTIKLAKSNHPRANDAKRALKFIKKVRNAQIARGEQRVVLYVRKDGVVHS